ncbi:hypothetical protein K2173_025445 [Erythroxylum novogranatense]|uniref:BZIP domain-containing protein n=1 Tax=Erythroxylum novogranatense TaxID=1862640 RepID=A0AAV8UHW5_9ROSI|nr:hypothetical protein K2173_025445 [Erythroxylum novogranatense]
MGNAEEGKSSKSDKSSSPAPQDQANIHVYPDWAAMQAYYGPRVALPPYYNSAVAPGHAPHPYMWAPPQPMMPPYGAPYAVYSPGGVYAHPGVPIGTHPHGAGVPSQPAAATPLSVETPTKSSGNTDRGLMKKLKGFDGLAMSIGNANGNTDSGEGGEHQLSPSEETEGSSDGSDGNTARARKRSRAGTPIIGDLKNETKSTPLPAGEVNASSGMAGKSVGLMVPPAMATALELRNGGVNAAKTSPTSVPHPCAVVPSEAWLQSERELKRERRKQSNRESARRSRLRKQAETEELARKVEALTAENVAIKSEIHQFTEKSEKLRLENAALMEKMKDSQLGHAKEITPNNMEEQRAISTENLLSRVNNPTFVERSTREEGGELYERSSKTGAKLHQLLDRSPRTDAVRAG